MAAGSTTAQLKGDIDSGRTASKVAAPDPGASPLGTDSEAGGASASPEEIDQAREAEAHPSLAKRDPDRTAVGKSTPAPDGRMGFSASPLVIGLGLGVAAAVVIGGGYAALLLH